MFTNVDSGAHSSIHFTLDDTSRVAINCPVNNRDYTSQGRGVIINLYGKTASHTYLLSSSAWSGLQVTNGGNAALNRKFQLLTFIPGSPTNVALECEFR